MYSAGEGGADRERGFSAGGEGQRGGEGGGGGAGEGEGQRGRKPSRGEGAGLVRLGAVEGEAHGTEGETAGGFRFVAGPHNTLSIPRLQRKPFSAEALTECGGSPLPRYTAPIP